MKEETMRVRTICLIGLVTLCSCASEKPTLHDVTVTFQTPEEVTRPFTTFLAVEKAGRTSIVVDTEPGPDHVSGRHNFPPHCNAEAIAQYYWVLLRNAGWKEGADLIVEGGQIRLLGVDSVSARVTGEEVGVTLEKKETGASAHASTR
jgi:hypothetical protein